MQLAQIPGSLLKEAFIPNLYPQLPPPSLREPGRRPLLSIVQWNLSIVVTMFSVTIEGWLL